MTLDELRAALHYDAVTGQFWWLVARGCRPAGAPAGKTDPRTGYVYIGVYGETYLAHRLAWFWMFGEWPRDQIDHKNRDKSDNRWHNLRAATAVDNSQNVPARGKYKGVTWHKGAKRWMAQIRAQNTSHYLGLFDTAIEAHQAYASAAKKFHGAFANY